MSTASHMPSKNRKLLIVAYWFPPAGGIAVQRALSLAKYLPRCGFEVHVLAPKNPPAPAYDPDLIRQIPPDVRIHRAVTPMPRSSFRKRLWGMISPSSSRRPVVASGTPGKRSGGLKSKLAGIVQRLLSPDPEVVWVPFALRAARRIIRQHSIDAVLVTAPPFSIFLVGNALKRQFPHLKLISDFRDDWLRFFVTAFDFQKSDAIKRQAQSIELSTVQLSDLVVLVTPSLLEETRARYPTEARSKFVSIPNGYDPEAFANFRPRRHEGGNIVVTYAGTVYGATSPRHYFEALDRLPDEVRSRYETRFIGRITAEEQALIERSKTTVRLLGFVPQSDALRHMEETDYLLLTMSDPTAATGKVYEYLATGKPILALSPGGGEVAQIIAETGAGRCVDPADPAAIRDMLVEAAGQAGTGQWDARRKQAAIQRYERPRLAAEFGRLIESCWEPVEAHSGISDA